MALSIGIVGLPNVGKSTLFTAMTNKGGLAANYPFATIEPNVGIVPVPDDRLDALAEIDHPAKIVPATVEFVDIAGLVAAPPKARAWAISSWPTFARPMPLRKWCASSATRTSPMWRARWTRSPMWIPSRPS